VMGFCDHCNELSDFVKEDDYVDRNCFLRKVDSVPWI
jgi:hypothetical protein